MNYFDDILNVYAYMFSKANKNLEKSEKLLADATRLEKEFGDVLTDAKGLHKEIDEKLEELKDFAEGLGIDISDLEEEVTATEAPVEETFEFKFEKIRLPENFDFEKDFQRLVEEAHAAGFTDAHPEDLLTEEEMAQANEFDERLDLEFARATGLTPKDMGVMTISVALRLLSFFVLQRINITIGSETVQRQGGLLDNQYNSLGKTDTPDKMPPVMGDIDATKGVDMGKILRDANSAVNLISPMEKIFGDSGILYPIQILDSETILGFDKPFELQNKDMFNSQSILAYNKFLGWIIGVANILTNTVTTFNLRSYSINRGDAIRKAFADKEVSTVSLLKKVMDNAGIYKTSVIAAVIQEALTLGFGNAQPSQVRQLFKRSIAVENTTSLIMERASDVLKRYNTSLADIVGGVATITLINTVVSAIHAMNYDEGTDGSIEAYSVRTGKIITYSGMLATAINSMPAIIAEDFGNLDYAGIITSLISFFQSRKFWIEAKANFLYGAYKAELEKEAEKINKYFE